MYINEVKRLRKICENKVKKCNNNNKKSKKDYKLLTV